MILTNDQLEIVVAISYLISSIFFIFGIKRLSHPKTATLGNRLGAIGMLIAAVTAFVDFGFDAQLVFQGQYLWLIALAIVAGSIVGVWSAIGVKMTGMPQMVAIFNGFGGASSFLVAGVFYQFLILTDGPSSDISLLLATGLSGLIGAITLSGSFIAFAKLQELKWIPGKPVTYKGDLVVKVLFVVGLLVGTLVFVLTTPTVEVYWAIVAGGLILGVLLVIGIGGADMPVVISLLNSYSGLAAAATGFVLSNTVLIISGSLVGASGLILTAIMTKAMNRSLQNVLFGGFGGATEGPNADDVYGGKVKSTSSDEVAMLLKNARRVVIVPGYGLAVARASGPTRVLTELMEADGIDVAFGIHPVAGRMPGHMNVLLAEENIAYEKLVELDTINPTFAQTDVVLVLGANDVVNPLARDPKSAIAGMPILDVDKAAVCIVVKRSLSPGFAGIPNPLFANENTLMLFADGKQAMDDLVTAYKEA
jgi:H+-translocating NAD(P) transhydrogenase subunit beta